MKKKVFTVVVSLLAILFLTACGNNKKSTNTSSSEVPKTSSSQKAEQNQKLLNFLPQLLIQLFMKAKVLRSPIKGWKKMIMNILLN